jgi:hypothetical protein
MPYASSVMTLVEREDNLARYYPSKNTSSKVAKPYPVTMEVAD